MESENKEPVECGVISQSKSDTKDIKQMFFLSGNRKRGIASRIFPETEIWSSELFFSKFILATGERQSETIGLYKRRVYTDD